jgi:hypothetical protein
MQLVRGVAAAAWILQRGVANGAHGFPGYVKRHRQSEQFLLGVGNTTANATGEFNQRVVPRDSGFELDEAYDLYVGRGYSSVRDRRDR